MQEIKKLSSPKSQFYQSLKKLSKNTFDKTDKNAIELKALKTNLSKNEKDIASLLDKIKYIDVSLLDDVSNEIKTLKQKNVEIENKIKELSNITQNEINDKETADILLNILDTYYNSFDDLDLNMKRTLIKTLVSSITSDGKDITINFLGARTLKDNELPTSEYCK